MNEKSLFFLLLAAIILLIAVTILLTRKRGLPKGNLIYDDLSNNSSTVKPFVSTRYGLAGKPDMIFRDGNRFIPVELKHSAGRDCPFPGHILQLAAYCLLIEDHFGIRPEYGIIRYRDKQFEISFTKELEQNLLSQLDKMRSEDPKKTLPPVCTQPGKCRRCGFSEICRQLSEPE